MSQVNSESAVYNKIVMKIRQNLIFFSLFFIYLIIRLLAWQRTILLEDHDSISYLYHIKNILSFDLQKIIDMGPDATPFYPFFGAICSLPGWSVETGARICSLIFSSLIFLALMRIGMIISKPSAVAIGLVIVSLSPILIPLSISVLTEPSYIGTVYLGLWIFWTQYENPRLWKAGLLGGVFGLSFLNRTEGILYIALIPLLQIAHFLFVNRKNYNLTRLTNWTLIYLLSFSLLAVPQIWRVSSQMGRLSLNGRQAWYSIYQNPDGKSYEEKIYGLDFSGSQINIEYVMAHPEILSQFSSNTSFLRPIKNLIIGLNNLYIKSLGQLFGPFVLILFGLGFLALYKLKGVFDILVVFMFIGFNLLPPLVYNPFYVSMRNIAVIAPLVMLLSGIGAVYIYETIIGEHSSSLRKQLVYATLLIIFLLPWAYPLGKIFLRPAKFNFEYNPVDFEEPLKIIKESAQTDLLRAPIILSRKSYLPYYADLKGLSVPYTDYKGLVRFIRLNGVHFLFLQHRLIRKYPFIKQFIEDTAPADFILLHRGFDSFNQKIELFRFKP